MALFLFLISLIGLLSALRLLREFHSRALISTALVTKTGTVMCTTILLSAFFCARDAFLALILIVIANFTLACVLWIVERREIDAMKLETPHFIDRWVLNMRLGHSLSSAREAAMTDSSERVRVLLRPLFINGHDSRREHLFLAPKVLAELRNIAETPHSALARLENLREMMRKSDEFRRKSGQARRQTTIQAVVLLFLHLALAIFTVHRYGWQRHSDLVISSFVLSAGGWAAMNRLARKSKWKI